MSNRRMNDEPKPRYRWQPLQRVANGTISENSITTLMHEMNLNRDDAIALITSQNKLIFANDLYQVSIHKFESNDGTGNEVVCLSIQRRDGGPILRDWRHFQQIKNELLSEEHEMVELYPAESRKSDTSNKFHLWGFLDPTHRFPFGWQERDVEYTGRLAGNIRQRPL